MKLILICFLDFECTIGTVIFFTYCSEIEFFHFFQRWKSEAASGSMRQREDRQGRGPAGQLRQGNVRRDDTGCDSRLWQWRNAVVKKCRAIYFRQFLVLSDYCEMLKHWTNKAIFFFISPKMWIEKSEMWYDCQLYGNIQSLNCSNFWWVFYYDCNYGFQVGWT